MPELPEVEVVVRQLRPQLLGRELRGIQCHHPDVMVVHERLIPSAIRGARILALQRRGKLMVMRLERDLVLTVHLRMTGRIWLCGAAQPRPVHTHVSLDLDGGQQIRFADTRRFGRIELLDADALDEHPFLSRLGPEPFSLQRETLRERLARRRGSIKGALLDQRVVAGLGNIYVDEILHRSGLHPLLIASRLRRTELDRLLDSMHSVLRRAIAQGGSSIRDYVSADGSAGQFQRQHRVFGRSGMSCMRCTSAIRKIRVVGRGTYLCPMCQPRRPRREQRTVRRSGGSP
jgi:formamidopyrimidine-DNA glycosylase